MKKIALVVALVSAVFVVIGTGTALAWGPGYGPGGMCGAMGGVWGIPPASTSQPIGLDQAEKAVRDYVASLNNSDLVVKELMEFQYNYYAIVNEKSSGIGAFELLVDKYSGRVYPEMGPNMMWNTKYGHMGAPGGPFGGMMGFMMGRGWGWTPSSSATPMSVSPEKAVELAQQYLAQYQPGTSTEEPHQFYGYYTLHTLKDGKITGMLSVNGYSGQVWYHSWHGAFVQEKEFD